MISKITKTRQVNPIQIFDWLVKYNNDVDPPIKSKEEEKKHKPTPKKLDKNTINLRQMDTIFFINHHHLKLYHSKINFTIK